MNTRLQPTWVLLALSASVMAVTDAYDIGDYYRRVMCGLALGLCLCLAGTFIRIRLLESPRVVTGVLVLCLAAQLRTVWAHGSPVVFVIVSLSFLLALIGVLQIGFMRRLWFPAIVCLQLGLSVWSVRTMPDPRIDVYDAQTQACAEMLRGGNPYAIRYHPGTGYRPHQYAPGMVIDGRVNYGMPYPPLSLLIVLPSFAITGELRYADVIALLAAALILGYTFPGVIGKLAACLLMLHPGAMNILQKSWTEPLVIFLFVSVIYLSEHKRSYLWIGLGLLLFIKQTMLLALPFCFLLIPDQKQCVRHMWRACVLAAAIAAPFFLWNPIEFWRSLVEIQARQPLRLDARSFLALAAVHGVRISVVVPFLLTIATAGVCLWRLPRTTAGFCSGLSLTFFVFFAFNKQAFSNYYFLVIALLLTALSAGLAESADREAARFAAEPNELTENHLETNRK